MKNQKTTSLFLYIYIKKTTLQDNSLHKSLTLSSAVYSTKCRRTHENLVMGSKGEIGGETQHKSYWTFSKQDFFPEESFQSWGNYHSALSQTCFQFKENLISCSDDANEIAELQKQSETEMKRCLTWWDLNLFGFGCHWSWYFLCSPDKRPAYMLELPLSCPILLLKSQQCSLYSVTQNLQLKSQSQVVHLVT